MKKTMSWVLMVLLACSPAFAITGDLNGMDGVTLVDAIYGLQTLGGVDAGVFHAEGDVNADGVPGLADVIYVLRLKSGLIPDADGDDIPDTGDNAIYDANPDQVDADGDGVGDAADECPGTTPGTYVWGNGCRYQEYTGQDGSGSGKAYNVCDDVIAVTLDGSGLPNLVISGQVTSGSGPVANALVSAGDAAVRTGADGRYLLMVSRSHVVVAGGRNILPVSAEAAMFADGYGKVGHEDGRIFHTLDLFLVPVCAEITETDDPAAGIAIRKDGEKIGELTVPATSLPAGVTGLFGTVAYLDPTTSDLSGFPGGDFLAIPQGGDPNAPVPLETLGLMSFDLTDQNGEAVTQLAGPATVCMKVPEGLSASVGESVPLWWYDVSDGLWKQDGTGVVEDRGADGLWICGSVTHFTWWNYDRPITTHACFKFTMVTEGSGLPVDLPWFAEGVDYAGISPARPCACDGDDPAPCPGAEILSVTVMRGSRIRMYALVEGRKFYLKNDGDGTFSLIQEPAEAMVFTAPSAQGSCFAGENVQNCALLGGGNGVLPVGGVNYAPRIVATAIPDRLGASEAATVSVSVADPEGTPVTISWSVSDGALTGFVPANGISSPSPATAQALFTAPGSETLCRLSVTATDADGRTATATFHVWVGKGPLTTVRGVIYGPDGNPLPAGVIVQVIEGYDGNDGFLRSTRTDENGAYEFSDIPCCTVQTSGGTPYCSGFYGRVVVRQPVSHPSGGTNPTVWTAERFIYPNCCGTLCSGGSPIHGSSCVQDIHFPTRWSTMRGTLYDAAGNPARLTETLNLGGGDATGNDFGELRLTVPVGTDGVYGPIPVPVGGMTVSSETASLSYTRFLVPKPDLNLVLDLGPGAVADLFGYVFTDAGQPASGVTVSAYNGGATVSDTTDTQGRYDIAGVPTGMVHVRSDLAGGAYGEAMVWVRGGAHRADINGPNAGISGTVLDVSGTPLPGVSLRYYLSGATVTVTTDTQGRFLIQPLKTGAYHLSVTDTANQRGSLEIPVPVANATVDVEFPVMPATDGCALKSTP